ncbi:hypothetical protein L598_004900000060 [Mesorhizobium sp. J18]|nr:hypothetical protein L598_004900000060 [Mesorhizobium sp. J18]
MAVILLSACVASTETAQDGAQPRFATYSCDDGTEMTVEAVQDKVHVVGPHGTEVELPASPPTQRSRYGTPPYALVIEGTEALWMVSGEVPVTCNR